MNLKLRDLSPETDVNKELKELLDQLCKDLTLVCPSKDLDTNAFNAIIEESKRSEGNGNFFDEFEEGHFSLDSTEGLVFSRLVARMAAASPEAPASGGDYVYFFASAWVKHLISPEGTRERFFLQEYVARDGGLYDAGSLRPRKWESGSCWREAYPWLRHPEWLTITEMELVLAIFRPVSAESTGRPRLVGWLERYPHLLWRIHRFLLSRYCFQLLRPFREALKNGHWKTNRALPPGSATASVTANQGSGKSEEPVKDKPPTAPDKTNTPPEPTLYAPPFRAGEFLTLYPRIAGLVAIGFLGLLQVDLAQVLFFATSWMVAIAASVVSLVILFLLNYMDVYKQNRGVMSDRFHGVGRALSLLGRFLAWGAIPTAGYVTLLHLCGNVDATAIRSWPSSGEEQNGLWNLLIPRFPPLADDGRFPLGLFAMISASCLLGALLQWFFEDTAATEPV
jgi:hypothetical protein